MPTNPNSNPEINVFTVSSDFWESGAFPPTPNGLPSLLHVPGRKVGPRKPAEICPRMFHPMEFPDYSKEKNTPDSLRGGGSITPSVVFVTYFHSFSIAL